MVSAPFQSIDPINKDPNKPIDQKNTSNPEHSKPLSQNFWVFIGYFLWPYKFAAVFYILLALLAGCWGPFNSYLIKIIINDLSAAPQDIAALTLPAILLVVNFIIFDNVTWRTIGYLNYKFQGRIKNSIIRETFAFVLGSSN